MMFDIIINNPYRILGVYSNSSKKEMITNRSKIAAFIKVGKSISFPTDLSHILGQPIRTDESIFKADSELTLPAEQLKYAQFWFIKATPLDDIAFNKLSAGNIESAIEIWNKKENYSSLQNKIICALIQARYQDAALCADRLYDLYRENFIKNVIDEAHLYSKEDLVKAFIDQMYVEKDKIHSDTYIDLKAIASSITDPIWKEYIKGKELPPIIAKMEEVISVAVESRKENPQNGIEISKRLRTQVALLLTLLKEFLSKEDLQYQLLVDKAGLEILQCAIDGYNKSDDINAVATDTLSLFKYAQSIVVGDNAKARCAKNIATVQKVIDELPPKEIEEEVQTVNQAITLYCKQPDEIKYAIELVTKCKPILSYIADMVGRDSSVLLKLSTKVADNALFNLVEEVDAVQKKYPFTNDSQTWAFNLARIRYTLSEAWKATLLIDSLYMDKEFRSNKWNPRKLKLRKLCDDYRVFVDSQQNRSTADLDFTSSAYQNSRQANHYNPSVNEKKMNTIGYIGAFIAMLVIAILWAVTGSNNKTTKSSYPTTSTYNSCSSNSSSSNSENSNNSSYKNTSDSYSSSANTTKATTSGVDISKIKIPYPITTVPSYTETKLRTGQYPFGTNKFDQDSHSELYIDNQSELDAVVVLENSSGKWIRNVFIGKKSSFTMTKIPYGIFIIKTMRGTSWNAEKDNGRNHPKGGFMKNCCYSKSGWDDPFDCRSKIVGECISYPHYSITLHVVKDGNFHTNPTTSDDFFE